mmetsp:Transcript_37102/g.94806  ORF Transcript_37102/g.94806 Transcript_37102/m.94806 type:complete len:348 (-) Transcript_37102:385-1428(-)
MVHHLQRVRADLQRARGPPLAEVPSPQPPVVAAGEQRSVVRVGGDAHDGAAVRVGAFRQTVHPAVQAGLQVVAVYRARCRADDAKVSAARDGNRRHGRGLLAVPQSGRRWSQDMVADGRILQQPGVRRGVALVRCDDVGPVPLAHLAVIQRKDTWQLKLLRPDLQLLGALLHVALAQLLALLVLNAAEEAEREVAARRQEGGAVSVVFDDGWRRGVAGTKAQQPWRPLLRVHKPLLHGIVRASAHQQRLAWEKVQRHHAPAVRVAKHRMQAALLQVPEGDGARGARGRHDGRALTGGVAERDAADSGAARGGQRAREVAGAAVVARGGAQTRGVLKGSHLLVSPQVV